MGWNAVRVCKSLAFPVISAVAIFLRLFRPLKYSWPSLFAVLIASGPESRGKTANDEGGNTVFGLIMAQNDVVGIQFQRPEEKQLAQNV